MVEQDIFACPHNDAVSCRPSTKWCHSCGWNPEVAKARTERFCKKLGIPVPVPRKPIQKEEE